MKKSIIEKINKLISINKYSIYHIVINPNKRLTKKNKSIEDELRHRKWVIKRIFKLYSFINISEYDKNLSMGFILPKNYELNIHNHLLVDIPEERIKFIQDDIKKNFKLKFKDELKIDMLNKFPNNLNISGYLIKQNNILSSLNLDYQFI